jgi:hypothetical protein
MIKEGESLVELKAKIPAEGIGPTIASFANSLGVWVMLGVEDSTRTVVGWKPPGRADDLDLGFTGTRRSGAVRRRGPDDRRTAATRSGRVDRRRERDRSGSPRASARDTRPLGARPPGGRKRGRGVMLAGDDALEQPKLPYAKVETVVADQRATTRSRSSTAQRSGRGRREGGARRPEPRRRRA